MLRGTPISKPTDTHLPVTMFFRSADVGIAMGTGTDVAMSSAQVTLVKGDLRGIVRARSISNDTVANMKQNLGFAFLYNALGVPIAAGEIGRAHVRTPVTNAHIVCSPLIEKKNKTSLYDQQND